MRLSLVGSTGWAGSTYASRFPLPLVSRTNGVHPCDFAMSPVWSYIFVLIQPRTSPPPLNQTVSLASKPNSGWCVPKQVLSGVYLPVFGSHTAAWRSDSLIGNAFADGRSDPARQYAGFSRPRVDAASHTRPLPSTIEL